MLNYTIRPISSWPGEDTPDSDRRRSQFKATFSNTMAILEREVRHLMEPGERPAVTIGLDVRDQDVRRDGRLNSRARPATPRCVVSFESRYGPRVFACDLFVHHWHWQGSYPDWHENLRAIALGLEALRKVERYGIARRGQQYAGFRMLAGEVEPTMGAERAAEFLLDKSGIEGMTASAILTDPEAFRDAWRAAARRSHPDTSGGSTAAFQAVQACKETVEVFHGD